MTKPEFNLPAVLHFLQKEYKKYESEKELWQLEKQELMHKISKMEKEKRFSENLQNSFLNRIKILEYALKQQKYQNQLYLQELKRKIQTSSEDIFSVSNDPSTIKSKILDLVDLVNDEIRYVQKGSEDSSADGYLKLTEEMKNIFFENSEKFEKIFKKIDAIFTVSNSNNGAQNTNPNQTNFKDSIERTIMGRTRKSSELLKSCLDSLNCINILPFLKKTSILPHEMLSSAKMSPSTASSSFSDMQMSMNIQRSVIGSMSTFNVPKPTQFQASVPQPKPQPIEVQVSTFVAPEPKLIIQKPEIEQKVEETFENEQKQEEEQKIVAAEEAESIKLPEIEIKPQEQEKPKSFEMEEEAEVSTFEIEEPKREEQPFDSIPQESLVEKKQQIETESPLKQNEISVSEISQTSELFSEIQIPENDSSTATESTTAADNSQVTDISTTTNVTTDESSTTTEEPEPDIQFDPFKNKSKSFAKKLGMFDKPSASSFSSENQTSDDDFKARASTTRFGGQPSSDFLKELEKAKLQVAKKKIRIQEETNKHLNIQPWKAKYMLCNHLDGVRDLAFLAENNEDFPLMLTCSEDGTAKLWNLKKLQKRSFVKRVFHTYAGHTGPVFSCVFLGENHCATAGADGDIRVWKIPPSSLAQYPSHGVAIPYNHCVLQGHTDVVWKIVSRIAPEHENQHQILSTSADGSIALWQLNADMYPDIESNPKQRFKFSEEDKLINPTCATFLPQDPSKVLASYVDSHIRLLDIETGKEIWKNKSDPINNSLVYTVIAHPTLDMIVSGSEDKCIRLIDPKTGKTFFDMVGHRDAVSSLDIDPSDGSFLMSGGHDSSIRFWDIATRSCIQDLNTHRKKYDESVHCVKYGKIGKDLVVASAGADCVVRIYEK